MSKYNKILILSDSFKNSISSKEIGDIGKNVISSYLPNMNIESYRIADGGEGTVDFFISELGFQKEEVMTVNCFNQEIKSYFGYKGDKAVFDVASCVGFHVNDHLDIWHASTYGIGIVLKEIIKKGFKKIYLGLGGSITNDGGMGILGAMGAKFYQDDLEVIPFYDHDIVFDRVDIDDVLSLIQDVKIIGLCDVNNPLIGSNGATYTYGPQKGASEMMLVRLEAWMEKYTKCFKIDSSCPGCGAAGGIGYCLKLIDASLVSGIQVMLDELKIDDLLDDKTLLITGEGALDNTSFQGKVIGYLSNLTKKHHTDMIIICGINKVKDILEHDIYPLHETVVSNYKETVYDDIKDVFKKIVKRNFLNFADYNIETYQNLPSDIRLLRETVFVKEQNIPYELEFDEYDDSCEHIALYVDKTLVASLRIISISCDKVKIGRFVVDNKYRGLGIGKLMVSKVIEKYPNKNIIVHAQTRRCGFYEKCGFVKKGDSFIEDGISHVLMELKKQVI